MAQLLSGYMVKATMYGGGGGGSFSGGIMLGL